MTRKKKKKKTIIKGKKLIGKDLQYHIVKLLQSNPKKWLTAKGVIKKLKITNAKPSVEAALKQLAEKGTVEPKQDNKFALASKLRSNGKSATKNSGPGKRRTGDKLMTGKVDMTRTGAAYILVEGHDDDIYVPSQRTGNAMEGDIVEVNVFKVRHGRRPEGEIVKVLERAADYFIGVVHISKKFAIVVPDKQPDMEIYIDHDNLKGAEKGEKVVVRITKWPTKRGHHPIGEVTSVLGVAGSSDIEMKAILINNGFELDFPEEVERESEAISDIMSEREIDKRRDMRGITTITIDPDTAKDFDDALSIQQLDNGQWEVGVHIADVTHYVKPDSPLDKEAYKRSTSVYLVDRVLPMLPEKLSNGVCSLRPHEDKFTFSAVFFFDEKFKLVDRWFGKTVTHSDRRFAYEEAQEILESGKGDFAKELKTLNTIAKKLRKQKFKKGAIAFEAEEVKFKLDDEGNPIDVYVKERKDAHMLIEDFMLLANKEVAAYIAKKAKGQEIPFVYRIHDEPNPDRVADFAKFAKELGVKIETTNPKVLANSFNNLAKLARKDEGLRILEPIAIRTMAKAVYSTENIGHYGLAFDYYSHFTSPIRRYSDVLTHRLLEKNLKKDFRTDKEDLEEKCRHVSAMERKAMTAERESIKYKQVEFIEKHVGEVFEGRINGMIDRGFFIELKRSKVEGMVSFHTMNESFEIEDSRLKATGKRSGVVYKMGQTVTVRIMSADLEKRQIEMEMVED